MKEFRADLHCHTTCSDGTVPPRALIQLAYDKELQGLSITDHDTIQAYDEAVPAAQAIELKLISGVEFSAVHQQTSVHILAYSFALRSPSILAFCDQHYQRRLTRIQAILDRLAAQGMPLVLEELTEKSAHPSLTRPHIAAAMMKKGYVSSIHEAFQLYLGDGKACYVSGNTFTVEETLDIIHQANGLAIIAHPHLIDKVSVLRDLLEMKFDGIEGYYGRFPASEHERWIKIGARKGWIITGGSDFHGDIKPMSLLGSSWVNEETFEILNQHFQSNQMRSS